VLRTICAVIDITSALELSTAKDKDLPTKTLLDRNFARACKRSERNLVDAVNMFKLE
jgi:hypothetical protein